MAPTEPPLVWSTSRWIELGHVVCFAVAGIVIATSHLHRGDGRYAVAICAGFVVIGITSLIEPPRLEVVDGVLTDAILLRRKSFDLRRCGRFQTRYLRVKGPRWLITFDYDRDEVPSRPVRRSRRARPNSFVEVHGHDAEEIARLLNQARDRARRTAA